MMLYYCPCLGGLQVLHCRDSSNILKTVWTVNSKKVKFVTEVTADAEKILIIKYNAAEILILGSLNK